MISKKHFYGRNPFVLFTAYLLIELQNCDYASLIVVVLGS